ncbi:MAG: sorbosone dehydrogenase family protein [Pseudomonadales bacterium]|nr:sorbosone dehydrogenase family protein [Pseudomonadales bacterium]
MTAATLLVACMDVAATEPNLQVPPGFHVETLNLSVPGARQMALTDDGTLLVGSMRQGAVYAIPKALTHPAPTVVSVIKDLRVPSGVAVFQGDLYIGALNEVIRIRDINENFADAQPEYITRALPDKTHHGWKYLKFSPDGKLYVPVGAPCNVCLSEDLRFASLLTMDTDTGETEIWASGIRNTVGFDWHPETGALWFSDNGRDMLGDDVPPEELNVSTSRGQHFGFPFVHSDDIDDPKFGSHRARPATHKGPNVEIQAHSAALGIDFYASKRGRGFPEKYNNALFVAEHGSWNRSSKVGYQVGVLTEDDSYQPFVTGWLSDGDVLGRPNDVLVTPSGELLISDDKRGVIYRVRYEG